MGPRYHGTLRSESPRLRAGRGGCRSGGPPDLPSSRAPPDRAGERGGLGRRHPSEWVCPPSNAQLLGLHFPGGVCGRGDLGRVPRAPQVQFPLGVGGLSFLSRGPGRKSGCVGGARGAGPSIPRSRADGARGGAAGCRLRGRGRPGTRWPLPRAGRPAPAPPRAARPPAGLSRRFRRWQRWPGPEPAMAGAPGPLRLALLLLGAVGRAGPRPQVSPAGKWGRGRVPAGAAGLGETPRPQAEGAGAQGAGTAGLVPGWADGLAWPGRPSPRRARFPAARAPLRGASCPTAAGR